MTIPSRSIAAHPKLRTLLVKSATCAAFITILVSFVQGNELAAVAKQVDWFYFSLSLLLAPFMLLVSCLKWKILLDLSGTRIGLADLTRIYFIGYFFSNLLPSTVGGDVVRSYYSGKLIGNQAFAAVCVFIERFTGMLLLLVLVVIAPLLKPGLYQSPFIFLPAIAAACICCLILWVWHVRNPLAFPNRIMQALFARLNTYASTGKRPLVQKGVVRCEKGYEGIVRRLEKFRGELAAASAAICRDRKVMAGIVLLTVFFYVLTWLNVYVSFLAFGVDVDFWAVSALVPTILFVAQVPLTLLGNLGYFESVFVGYFLLVQVPIAGTLMMGLLLRLKIFGLGLVGLGVYLFYRRGKASGIPGLERDLTSFEEKD